MKFKSHQQYQNNQFKFTQMKPKKKARGAQAQLKRSARPTLGGSSGGTGVYMSS